MAIRTDIGLTYFYSGQFERAATHFRQLRGIDPTFQRSYLYLGQALEADGKFDEAIGAFETYYTLTGEERQQRFYQRLRERFRGTVHSEYWKAKLQVTSEIGGRGPFEIAGMYAHIGDADKAFEELEKAFRARNGGLLYVMVRPEFEPLRSDPRFAVLTRRVGLE
jgi:tetratricopeptide (TPR) repeat protein